MASVRHLGELTTIRLQGVSHFLRPGTLKAEHSPLQDSAQGGVTWLSR